MTTLYLVPRDLFFTLKERRHLRRLADVLLGSKPASLIGLEVGHHFPALDLGPGVWEGLAGQIEAFEPINGNRYAGYLTDRFAESFSHGKLRPAFWTPRSVLVVLSSFMRLWFDVVVEGARARASEQPGPDANAVLEPSLIRLDPAKLIACGVLRPGYSDYQSFVAPAALDDAIAAVCAWAEARTPGAAEGLRRDLAPVLRWFTDAWVGDWAAGDDWDRLGRTLVVRITR